MRSRLVDHNSRALVMALIVLIELLSLTPEMVRAQSANDGFDPNANGDVLCLAVQADGKIVVGGDFSQLSGQARTRIGRVNPDGSLDTSFNPGADGYVRVLAMQADGKILVGGEFALLGGQPRSHIGRLNADGLIDASFNPSLSGPAIYAMAVQTDGKILVGGDFSQLGGQHRDSVGRLNADGSLDTSFNPAVGGFPFIQALAAQADGKILVGGLFTDINGQTHNNIVRLNSDGTPDISFNPAANNAVVAITLQTDGKILLGGAFTQLNGQSRNRIGRLNSDGSLDAGFIAQSNDGSVTAIVVQTDGKILVGGGFNNLNGQARSFIGRLNIDGSLDTTFNPGANSFVFALGIQADGKILVSGHFTQLAAGNRNRIGRLGPDGSLDATLNPGPNDLVLALAVQADGKILVGGRFNQLGGQPCNRIGRLNTDGSLEAGFNPGANDDVNAIAVQADGKILFAGRFTQLGGQTRNRIGRLNSDGSLDNSFNPGANGEVDALAVQTDGKILVGGFFSQLGGQGRNNIGRLSPDGSLDPSFNPGTNNGILALAVQTDGKILLGGGFTQLGGQTRNGIGRLNADGSLDMSFTPGANSQIDAIVVQADGKIVLGGGFTQLGGQPRLRLGRLNSDGSLDVVFHPDADNTVFTLAVQADGKILVGGFFSQLSGLSRVGIGRLYPEDAAVDPSFNSGQGGVVALAMQSDGKVLIGGFFTQLGGQPRNNIGRLTNTDAALQNLSVSPDGSTIQWLRSGTGPEVSRVTFEASTDGVNYFLIGSATRIAGGWQLTGVSLPKDQNIFIRARGFYSTGYDGASGSVVESVRNTFLPAPPLFCPCPPAGIISWWPGQNNAQDIVSHYDGTMQNGATFATGMVGQAVSLDGIDDAVVVNNNLGLNPTSITVEAWVKPNSVPVGTLKDVVTKWGFDATRDSYLIGLLNSGSGITIIGGIGDGATGDPGLSGGTVPLNTWSHIAMTYDASSGVNRLYLNGTQVNQRVRANGIFPTTTRVFIGGEDSSQGRFFSGLIDEPTIYSRALTSSEILAIYNAGSNGKPTPIRGTLQLSQVSYSVNEDAGIATVTVTRSGDTSVPTTVKYATSDATDVNFRCNPATQGQIVGAASRKCDYHIASGRLRFAAGETTRTIVISIVNDVYVEGGESFTLTLSSPTGAALGAPNTATVTINDNDNPGQANPIDGTSFFVRMLYVDLLSREPDPLGYAGWVHRIDFCGQAGEPPPPCDRVTVGGDGFLRSTEFFDREFFVIRLYRAGLGRIPRYDDVGDLAYVSGFLTDADLESNKQELVADIMSRSEFGGLYNGLSNGQFVDKLIQTAAVTMPQNVRDGWVTALDNASKTRAVIYRELSERPEVSNRYLHEAQVVSCYYGFFTRNPDGAYFNYLDRLDRGEITLGDLAFAFINAAEYRQRFGP